MKFNARLILMMVVIGLFVRVWKTNEHPRTRPVERSRHQAAEKVVKPAIVAAEVEQPAMTVSAKVTREEHIAIEELWTAESSPIPLPEGIAEGSYRAVSDSGRIARLVITGNESSRGNETTAALTELLTLVVGGERWYLLRLKTEPAAKRTDLVPDAATSDVTPIEPLIAPSNDLPEGNRKFDFTGYVTAPSPALEGLEQAARPAPPEMPSPL